MRPDRERSNEEISNLVEDKLIRIINGSSGHEYANFLLSESGLDEPFRPAHMTAIFPTQRGMVVYQGHYRDDFSPEDIYTKVLEVKLPERVKQLEVQYYPLNSSRVNEIIEATVSPVLAEHEDPIAFIIFGKTEQKNNEVVLIYHHAKIPPSYALARIQQLTQFRLDQIQKT